MSWRGTRWIGTAAVVSMLMATGCTGSDSNDFGDDPLYTPDERVPLGDMIDREDVCEILGADLIDQFADDYGYEITLSELEPGSSCGLRIGRVEDNGEHENIVFTTSANQFDSAEGARTNYAANADPESQFFHVVQQQDDDLGDPVVMEPGGGWDEGLMVAGLDWSIQAQINVLMRAGPITVKYQVAISLKGDVDVCARPGQDEPCAIPPETVLDWLNEEFLPQTAEQVRAELVGE